MKKILLFLVCCAALPVCGQDKFKGEDFDNQSEIIVQDSLDTNRCQAVRIAPKWYLTAAHCVAQQCNNKPCDIMVNLLQGDLQASAVVHHKPSSHERVFIQYNSHENDLKSVRSDMALIFFDPQKSDYFFRLASLNKVLNWGEFTKLLEQTYYSEQRARWKTLEHNRAKLYVVTNATDRHVLKPVAVPDLVTNTQAVGKDFYYFNQLQYYIGLDIGVDHGMSGSGVIVPGGGIIGVVSTVAGKAAVPATVQKEKPAGQAGNKYFLFAPINRDNEDFIRATLTSSKIADSGPLPYMVAMDPKVAEITAVRLADVFGDFAAAEEKGVIASKN